MRFDGLIFDLDGTLWNCSKASAAAFNHAFERFGLTRRIDEEFVQSISGKPANECDELLLLGLPSGIRRELVHSLDELEISAIREYAPGALYPDVHTGINELQKHYGIYVVSNCTERYLEAFLALTSIGCSITDSECYGRTKRQKHENIRAVVQRNNLACACYVGDTSGDEQAAADAGIPFFHAAYGFGTPQHNPPAFSSFADLTSYFVCAASQPKEAAL